MTKRKGRARGAPAAPAPSKQYDDFRATLNDILRMNTARKCHDRVRAFCDEGGDALGDLESRWAAAIYFANTAAKCHTAARLALHEIG